ncbi:uncharacterized protein LOC129613090 [Condylostylus longicornis]|uniref:uncharacterized protein LOC129613090 n=1 Tax=Condylostylus longicornis TaxID=2530218 RepID=UPI00244E507F|nr:uncharacterized protein LOC129613090 [Condylostylus longicornis]
MEIATIDNNSYKSDSNNLDNNENNNENGDGTTFSLSSSAIYNLSWDCANNSTCIQNIARNLINNYENGQSIDFGLFSIERLAKMSNNNNNNNDDKEKDTEGRSLSTIQKFIEGNAIRIPIGPMVFSLQRSDDDPDYMELALLKRVNEKEEASLKGRGRGGIGGIFKKKRGHKEKKHLQVFIPMYLAANTFGWTLLAVKAVGVLTIKALIVSKLAFLIATGIIVKKMMDSAQQKMLFPHHHPYLMPYNMDYGLQAHSMPGAEEYLNLHLANHQALENMAAAETNHVVHAIQGNSTQPQLLAVSAINGNPNTPKIKRSDQWSGVHPSRPSSQTFYNYLTKTPPASPYVYQK